MRISITVPENASVDVSGGPSTTALPAKSFYIEVDLYCSNDEAVTLDGDARHVRLLLLSALEALEDEADRLVEEGSLIEEWAAPVPAEAVPAPPEDQPN